MFENIFREEAIMIENVSLNSSNSINGTLEVSTTDRSVVLAVHFDPQHSHLQVNVTDPTEKTIYAENFSKTLFFRFEPELTGKYTVVLSNLDSREVIASMLFGHLPKSNNESNMIRYQELQDMIISTTLIILGIALIAAGVIIRVAYLVRKASQ